MAKSQVDAQIKSAMAAPYARVLWKEPDGSWGAKVLEFPGCNGAGKTLASVMKNLEAAMEDWISDELVRLDGDLPEPIQLQEPSGRISLGLPAALRRRVAGLAAMHGVSQNRWLTDAVTEASLQSSGDAQRPPIELARQIAEHLAPDRST